MAEPTGGANVPTPKKSPSDIVFDTLVDAVGKGLDYLSQLDPETAKSYGDIKIAELFGHIVAPHLAARLPSYKEPPKDILKAMRAKNLALEAVQVNQPERAPAVRRFANSMFKELKYESDPVVKAVVQAGPQQPVKVDIGPEGLRKAMEVIVGAREVDDDVYEYMLGLAGGKPAQEVKTFVRGRSMETSKVIPPEIVSGVARGAVQALTERVPVPKGAEVVEGGRAVGEKSLNEIASEVMERTSRGENKNQVIRDIIGRFAIRKEGEIVLPYRGIISALFAPPKGKMRARMALNHAAEAVDPSLNPSAELAGKPYAKLVDELNLDGLALLAAPPDTSMWDHARRIRTKSTFASGHLGTGAPLAGSTVKRSRVHREDIRVKKFEPRRPNFGRLVTSYTQDDKIVEKYDNQIARIIEDAIVKNSPAEAADVAKRGIEDYLVQEELQVPEGWSTLIAGAVHDIAKSAKGGQLGNVRSKVESLLWKQRDTLYRPLLDALDIKMADVIGKTEAGHKARSAPVAYFSRGVLSGFGQDDLEDFWESIGRKYWNLLTKTVIKEDGTAYRGMDVFLREVGREFGPMVSQSTLVRLATPSFVKLNMPRPHVLDFAFGSQGLNVLNLPTIAKGELSEEQAAGLAKQLVMAADKGLSRNVPKPLVHSLIGMAKHAMLHWEGAVADKNLMDQFRKVVKRAGLMQQKVAGTAGEAAIEESIQSFNTPGEIYGQKLADAFFGRSGKEGGSLVSDAYLSGKASIPPALATPDRLGFALSVAEPASKMIEAVQRGQRGIKYMFLANQSRGLLVGLSRQEIRQLARSTRGPGEKVMLRYMAPDLVAITDPGLVALWQAVRDRLGDPALTDFAFGKAGLPRIGVVRDFLGRYAESERPLSPLYFEGQLGG